MDQGLETFFLMSTIYYTGRDDSPCLQEIIYSVSNPNLTYTVSQHEGLLGNQAQVGLR